MNVLTIIVLLLLIVLALNGYRKGFIKVFASMSFFILASVLVYFANPYVSQFLKDHTPVYAAIEKQCEEVLQKEGGRLSGDNKEEVKAKTEKSDQLQLIEELPIPQILKDQLTSTGSQNEFNLLDTSDFTKYIAAYMADAILSILSFVVTVIVVTLILRLSVMTLNIVANLPVLNGANRVLGLALGLVQGILTVWFAFLVITLFSQTDMGKQLLNLINESMILTYIYDNNIFLRFLL